MTLIVQWTLRSASMAATFFKLFIFFLTVAYIRIFLQFNHSHIDNNEFPVSCKGSVLFKDWRYSNIFDTALLSLVKFNYRIYSSRPKIRRSCTKWHKHGLGVLMQTPVLEFPKDLTIHMDVEANPGETDSSTNSTKRSRNCLYFIPLAVTQITKVHLLFTPRNSFFPSNPGPLLYQLMLRTM